MVMLDLMLLQLSKFKKTSDLSSLLYVYRSGAQDVHVIIRLKSNEEFPPYCVERSRMRFNLATGLIKVQDLMKLELDDNVISWNCAKPNN